MPIKKAPTILVKDYNGGAVVTRQVMINEGMNSIEVTLKTSLPAGFYVVSITTDSEGYGGRIMKVSEL